MTQSRPISWPVELGLVLLLLLLTAVLRLGWPGLTEFKADEARLTLLALQMAQDGEFALRGISSSVGFPNFPMSVWLYALPLAVWPHAYAATLFTGLLNTLAVLGCYWLVRRYWGVEAALVAMLLFAVSPWAVHHSRKIWAQNLLPFFIVVWGIAATLAFAERRPRWLVLHFLALAIAAQAHLAAFALLPVTAVLLLIYWRRLDWRWLGVGVAAALLTVLPFIIYLLTDGRRFLAVGEGAGTAVSARSWNLSALRSAWLLFSGREIHALAGPAAFRDYLATVPDLTWVHLIWGVLAVAGLGVLVWQGWGTQKAPQMTADGEKFAVRRDVIVLLLLWLLVPLLFFSVPLLPSALHYLLPVYPIPFMAVGVAVAALPRRWRWGAHGALLLTAAAQVWVWARLLAFVAVQATPGGFGTPLVMQLAATDTARQMLQATGAAELLIAGAGERPLLDDFPAVYDVLLWDLPHRFVDVTDTAVFPAQKSVVLLDAQGAAADLYRQTAAAQVTVPLRTGEGALDVLALPETAAAPQHRFDPPHILTNWAAFAGYDDLQPQADGAALWTVYWYAGEASAADYHLFNHLLDVDGARIGQADTAVFRAAQWREGDLVATQVRLPWSDAAAQMRTGMYTYPDLTPVRVFDVAGNPTADAITIPLPLP